MSKRINQEINAGSMADIAFLLLIFFLVTTSMTTDTGIIRKLPPAVDDVDPTPIKKRNIMEVLVNRENKLMVRGKPLEMALLKNEAKKFIANEGNDLNLPEKDPVDIPMFGTLEVTKNHVISLQSDRGTSYKTYIAVQNELAAAYNELRDELAKNKWGTGYNELDDKKKDAIDMVYPMHISEAEPKNAGGSHEMH